MAKKKNNILLALSFDTTPKKRPRRHSKSYSKRSPKRKPYRGQGR